MQMIRSLRQKWMIVALLLLPIFLVSCGGGGGGGGGNGGGGGGGSDFYKLSVDGGGETTYTEAFSAAAVCDPRVDWYSHHVLLQDNFLGGSNWEMIFDIILSNEAVGTYDVTVSGDGLSVLFMDSSGAYYANFGTVGSSGTVTVTRSDSSRIEGTYAITAVDGVNPINLSGSFGVESGFSLSWP
jgi:hypothetical protein